MNPERLAKGIYWDRSLKLDEGCTPVSEGCEHCWSAKETYRMAHHPNKNISGPKKGLADREGFNGNINLRYDNLDIPLHTRKPTVWAIWNDLFHEDVPADFIQAAFDMMIRAQWHTYLILTKRADRMAKLLPHIRTGCGFKWKDQPWEHVWPGVTVENQDHEDRIEKLIQTPAAHRWVSIEPMLGPVESDYNAFPFFAFENEQGTITPGIDAVVLGGETGSGARPMEIDWVRSVRDQCQAAKVSFFFKQWGEWAPVYAPGSNLEGADLMQRVGRKKAGRLLDGRPWDELPWYATNKTNDNELHE